MALQPTSDCKMGPCSQSDVDIPGERDQHFGPLLPKRSDDDNDDDDDDDDDDVASLNC